LFQKRLEQSLIASGLLTKEQLAEKDPRLDLAEHLLNTGLMSEGDITRALSRLHHLPIIKLNNRPIHPNALNTVPSEIVTTHQFFPLEFLARENCLVLVTSNPASLGVMLDLRRLMGCEVEIFLGPESVVKSMIELYCSLSAKSTAAKSTAAKSTANDERSPSAAQSNPTDLADRIVRRARATGASELQVERFGEFIWTRFTVGEDALNLVL
jgi:hypothetical protein